MSASSNPASTASIIFGFDAVQLVKASDFKLDFAHTV
jgi:hypothetical protein